MLVLLRKLLKIIIYAIGSYSIEKDPILITGETGVGKSFIARNIHRNSGREGRFEILNCANIPKELFESELFGYKRGAFTGAIKDKPGLFTIADKGTLFLDEIGELPYDMQSKLLSVIEEKKYRRLGEEKEIRSDVRIITATNRDIEEYVKENSFRKDLYYRINFLRIQIPPLRERKEEIIPLILSMENNLKGKRFTDEALRYLTEQKWTGNIRELFSIVKIAAIENEGDVISEEEIKKTIEDRNVGSINKHTNNNRRSKKTADLMIGIDEGKSFWDTIWKSFIERDIDRETMKELLNIYYKESSHSYKKMINKLNMDEKDYKKFISLLHKYKINQLQQ